MEINVRSESRIVEIWLTNAEKRDEALREQLKPLYKKYQAKNYLAAVFESGQRDLCDAAGELLRCNRSRLARLGAETETQGGTAMEP